MDTESEPEINATVIENNENIILNLSRHDNLTLTSIKLLNEKKVNKSNNAESFTLRNIDAKKIQSNTKDIIDDGENIVSNTHRKVISPTSPPILRTTLPNVFSNSGGNGGNLDSVQLLSLDGSNRKRHRNRRQFKSNTTIDEAKSTYEARVARLRHELTRPSESPVEQHLKPKQNEKRRKSKKKMSAVKTLADVFATQQETVEPTSSIHHRVTRAATAKKDRIWDYGVIPYEIDANFSGAHKALFKQGEEFFFLFHCACFCI